MFWIVAILLFIIAAVCAPVFVIGIILLVIGVCVKLWVYPSDEKVTGAPYDPEKPWNEGERPQEDTVLYLEEEKPWNCEEDLASDDSDDIWEKYDREVQDAKDLAKRLLGKVDVESEFWEQWGLDFRCNLIAYGTELRLNYEIVDRESRIPWDEEPGFWLQTNFYDAEDRLLYGSEYDINMDSLKQHRSTGYCLFDVSLVDQAERVLIYGYRVY